MKKIIMVSFLAASLFVLTLTLLPSFAADDSKVQRGTVSVSYSSEKEVTPDTVEFSLSIKTSDKKSMNEASRKNKEISNKIYDYLKASINPLDGDYIKTSNYRANPVYTYINNKRTLDRYEVSNNIIVHTKSLDKIANLIDKSISLGATDVNSLNFSLSNKDNQCNDLISAAAKQVKSRADIVVSALGTSVTGIQNVNASCSLNQRYTNYNLSNMRMMKSVSNGLDAAATPEVSTSIEAGNITIYANVDAAFYTK